MLDSPVLFDIFSMVTPKSVASCCLHAGKAAPAIFLGLTASICKITHDHLRQNVDPIELEQRNP